MSLWYAQGPGALNVRDGVTNAQVGRITLTGTDRINLIGTGRLSLASATSNGGRSATMLGTVEIVASTYQTQFQRSALLGNARATLSGDGRINLFDFRPSGRLVLLGVGGGS